MLQPTDSRLDPAYRADVAAMPAALRLLLGAELDAGNSIVEVGHSFPAPPAGAYFKLAQRVSTRPRASGDGLTFYERNTLQYLGEFTDDQRFFWILEPPEADDSYPDMDAIRQALAPKPFVESPDASPNPESTGEHSFLERIMDHVANLGGVGPASDSPYGKFIASMNIDYERWKDGIGYDMDALVAMSPVERQSAEARVTPPKDWRDIEALAVIDSPNAREVLRSVLENGAEELSMSVLRYAPELATDEMRTRAMIRVMPTVAPFNGLTALLDEVDEFHPPAIEDALFAALLSGSAESAYHFAATLATLRGVIESRYDWSMRPLFLRFSTSDREERRAALLALCEAIGEDGPARLAQAEQHALSRDIDHR